MNNVSATLNKMRKAGQIRDNKAKGDLGEDAVLAVLYDRKQQTGNGLLYQSFKYPYQTNRQDVCYLGNIFYNAEKNEFSDVTDDKYDDEIDVLYVTPYRVFPIEVKSYHTNKIEVYVPWMNKGGTPVDKSPILQAEKHARHLYHAIYDVLPDGKPEYIVPLVCFVDRCKLLVEDEYEQKFGSYLPVCILNNLLHTLNKYNQPGAYNLDIGQIQRKLDSIKTSIRRTL